MSKMYKIGQKHGGREVLDVIDYENIQIVLEKVEEHNRKGYDLSMFVDNKFVDGVLSIELTDENLDKARVCMGKIRKYIKSIDSMSKTPSDWEVKYNIKEYIKDLYLEMARFKYDAHGNIIGQGEAAQINRMVSQIIEGKSVRNIIFESTEKDCVLDIYGIRLLKEQEFAKYRSRIPKFNDSWWLASAIVPSDDTTLGRLVWDDDQVIYRYVGSPMYYAVRPVLDIDTDLAVGSKFKFMNYVWTVISNSLAICDDSFGNKLFRKDAESKDANDYRKSDINEYLKKKWDSVKGNKDTVEFL